MNTRRRALLFVTLPAALLVGCSTHAASVPSAGGVASSWVGSGPSTVLLIQWTNIGGHLTGELSEVDESEAPRASAVPTEQALTGEVAGQSVTLHLGPSENLTGTIGTNSLVLNIPQSDGTVAAFTLHPGTPAEYNEAVASLTAPPPASAVAPPSAAVSSPLRAILPVPTTASGCTSKPSVVASPIPDFPILPAGVDPTLNTEPIVTIPGGPVPTKTEVTDLVVGTGATVGPHDSVTVNYLGLNYVNCSEFDSSWSRDEPATFSLDGVVTGFAKGVGGDSASGISPMKVGGRREIIVTPADGYGTSGSGAITPNEELVFVVDVLAVSAA